MIRDLTTLTSRGRYTESGEPVPLEVFTAGRYSYELVIIANMRGAPIRGYAPLLVYFVDRSDAAPPATSWNYDFGDGQSSTVQNPAHEYGQTGEYVAKLAVTNPVGTDSKQVTITVTSLKAELKAAIKQYADAYGTPDVKNKLGSAGTDWARTSSKYGEMETFIEGLADAVIERAITRGQRFDGGLVKVLTDFIVPNVIKLNNVYGLQTGITFGITGSAFNDGGKHIIAVDHTEQGIATAELVNGETGVALSTAIGPPDHDVNVEQTIDLVQATVYDNMPGVATEQVPGTVKKGDVVTLIPSPSNALEVAINDLITGLKTAGIVS